MAGIALTVRDSETGLLAACGAVGVVTAIGYSAAMDNACDRDGTDRGMMWGAWERPGVYSVLVQEPGYESWWVEGILVAAGECHVHAVRLLVEQVPFAPVSEDKGR